jgi:YjjG family noncanonical pyrimidine nucleotidase
MNIEDLFFDLDHTIWDFEANANETLKELHEFYRIEERCGATTEDFLSTYHEVNDKYWDLYRKHKIEKTQLRTIRFSETFELLGLPKTEIPEDIWSVYLDICPTKTQLIPGARETLDYLGGRYKLHIITNGFAETQRRKLEHSSLSHYFTSLTISEEVGFQKPHPTIFNTALQNANSSNKQGHYIGDNPIADVQGGLNSGWNVVWFNPDDKELEPKTIANSRLRIISNLAELKDIY